MSILVVSIFIFLPVLILLVTENSKIANRIGAIILAYALGLILGHSGLITHPSDFLSAAIQSGKEITSDKLKDWLAAGSLINSDILAFKIHHIQDLFTQITIPLALPLLLFSLKIKAWFRMSGATVTSMLLAMVSVIVFIVIGHIIFGSELENSNKISGMLVGLYTGGTPNLASLKQSLGVDVETYIMTHTYDTAVGVFYLLFLITVGKKLFRFFLRPYPKLQNKELYENINFSENAYKGIFKKKTLAGLLFALVIAICIVGLSALLGMVFKEHFMLVVILSITTLGIVASFIPRINKIEKTFELGMYFILVFSLVVASMADISRLVNISYALFGFITLVYLGALILHAVLCRLFKVDADTLMVTSTALLCSPPFVPMVAGSLRNKEVIVSGLTVGIMGYAVGNYLGVILAGIL